MKTTTNNAVTALNAVANMSADAIRAQVKPVAGKQAKALTIHATLLETVRAMDGSTEDRFNVAHTALTSAYTQALTYGNKTQLTQVAESDGRKVCERAMRMAVQTIGVLGMHKDAVSRTDAIEGAVIAALDIFASIACVAKAPAKAVNKAGNTKVVKLSPEQLAAETAAIAAKATADKQALADAKALAVLNEKALADAQTLAALNAPTVASSVEAIISLIQTGALSSDEIDLIETALLMRRSLAITPIKTAKMAKASH